MELWVNSLKERNTCKKLIISVHKHSSLQNVEEEKLIFLDISNLVKMFLVRKFLLLKDDIL